MLRQCPKENPLGIPTEAIPAAEHDSGATSQDNAIATSDSASRPPSEDPTTIRACTRRVSGTIPSWAVTGTADQVIPPAELTFMARRAGAHITDVDAGHLSLVSEPSVVTRVILKAVQATG
jgi:pimeloyl-ACP methyl ester carboxylesterase